MVIPTFNEAENIGPMIDAVCAALPTATVLVVDDGSPDGTADVVETTAARHDADRVHVLRRPGKAGLGTAYVAGFDWGLERHHDVLIQMDADFQHDPAYLPALLAGIDAGADSVIGSRYVTGGSVPAEWPTLRKLLSRWANAYARTALRLPMCDVTAGFRAHRASLLERIDLLSIGADGYGFQIGLSHRTARAGAQIVEVPIHFGERTRGESKMSLSIVVEAFLLVARTAVRRR